MKTNKHLDASTIKTGVDSRLAGLYIDESMKANILNRIENNNTNIKVYNPKKKTTIRKVVTILIAACLCFAITIPVIGAIVPGVYTNIFKNTEPEIPEETAFPDDNNSDYFIMVDNGIEFSIASAYYDGTTLLFSFELKDTKENRMAADVFTYNVQISNKIVVDYNWYDNFDPETQILTVYMICHDIDITNTTTMFKLDTLFDTRADSIISGLYQQMHEVSFVEGYAMDPMINVDDFVIDDFRFSPLSFSLSGFGNISSDLLYTMTVYMHDGSYKVFSGGLLYGQNGEAVWEQCTETAYTIDGEVIYTNSNLTMANSYTDGILSQSVYFYQPLDYENLSHVVLAYSGTEQIFTFYP